MKCTKLVESLESSYSPKERRGKKRQRERGSWTEREINALDVSLCAALAAPLSVSRHLAVTRGSGGAGDIRGNKEIRVTEKQEVTRERRLHILCEWSLSFEREQVRHRRWEPSRWRLKEAGRRATRTHLSISYYCGLKRQRMASLRVINSFIDALFISYEALISC